jgi:hypothetical protein
MHEHHKNRFELAQLAIRARICTKCYQRPAGSEHMAATQVRSCEPTCTIFLGLPKLVGETAHGPLDEAPDEAMRRHVCPTCHASASAGDYCSDRLHRTCPLSRYGSDVLQILEDLHCNQQRPEVLSHDQAAQR